MVNRKTNRRGDNVNEDGKMEYSAHAKANQSNFFLFFYLLNIKITACVQKEKQ